MSLSGTFKSLLGSVGKYTNQQFQENFDMIKACLLLSVNKQQLYSKDKQSDVELLSNQISCQKSDKLNKMEQDLITNQLEVLFQNIAQVDEELYSKKTPNAIEGLNKGVNNQTIVRSLLSKDVQEMLFKKQGWNLYMKSSSIENAGNGVFVNGHINPGTVLGFFPGTVYLRQHLKNKTLVNSLTSVKSDYRYWYYDSSIVDSKDFCPMNPLSFGHIMNHPPKGSQPNVILCPIDIPKSMNIYSKYIPNQYIQKERSFDWINNGHVIMQSYIKSMVMVSSQHIDNNELFYDYCLPKNARPSWYWEVDQTVSRKWDVNKKTQDDIIQEQKEHILNDKKNQKL